MNKLSGLWWLIPLVLVGPCQVGCAGGKAVDSTVAVHDIEAQPTRITYTLIPGALTDDAELRDKILAIPLVPGKNVDFVKYNVDGSKSLEFHTSRSAVIDTLLSKVSEVDAGKFAEDAAQREFSIQIIDRALSLAQPFLGQLLSERVAKSNAPAGPSGPEKLAQYIEVLKQAGFTVSPGPVIPPSNP